MPEPVADREQPTAVVAGERLVVLVEIGHVGEGRGQPVVVGSAQARAGRVLELAEAARERELLIVVDVLIVEDQHRVLVHALVDRRHLVGGERLAGVQSLDLGGEAWPDLTRLERRNSHREASCLECLDSNRRLSQSLRTRGKSRAAVTASTVRARPLRPRAALTPKSEASAPIWNWPRGASPIATTQAPPARPRRCGGTLSWSRLWASRSASAPAALATISTTATPTKPTRYGAAPTPIRLAPNAPITRRKKAVLPRAATRVVAAVPRPSTPPTARDALSTPSPSGPAWRMSRARLGSTTW